MKNDDVFQIFDSFGAFGRGGGRLRAISILKMAFSRSSFFESVILSSIFGDHNE